MISGFIMLLLMSTSPKGIDSKFADCLKLEKKRCFDRLLHHNWTSLPPFTDNANQTEARRELQKWQALKAVPSCWQIIAPFLCHVYFPKCSNGSITLPCKSLCNVVRDSACTMIPFFNEGTWPKVLNCDYYSSTRCTQLNPSKNQSFRCQYPLIETSYKKNWYNGIKYCGLECQNQFYSKEEHRQIHITISVLGSLSLICNLFSVATFLIDWKAQNKYPAKIIFFMNLCFFVSSMGWLLQFVGDTRNKITCRQDGTRRIGEPGSNSDGYGWCLLSFILIYYFSFAGIMWFVMLSYAWHSSFRTLGSTQDKLSGKKTYFHVLSWMIPVISTILILVLEQVDGDSVVGICFVGIQNHGMRQGFVLVPYGICLLIGEAFMIRGTIILFKVKGQNLTFLNGRASTKIKETIIRIGIFSLLSCIFFISVLASHAEEAKNWNTMHKSLMEYVRCKAVKLYSKSAANYKCVIKSKRSVALIQLQVISAFGAGITVSTWSWTKATMRTWKKAWIRFRGFDVKKRIQNSFNARKNKKRIAPLVEQALPAIALAVPLGTRAKRGSLASVASKQSSKLKISSFISGFIDEIRSKMKSASGVNTKQNNFELRPSPIVIRPPDGRRRSLLSIESILTTSSQGRLRLRRSSMPTTATNGSDFGMAFGHQWSIQPQIHVPTKDRNKEQSRNLRVIRLGEDMTTTGQKDSKSENISKGKRKKKRQSRGSSRVAPVSNSGTETLSIKSVAANSNCGYLPPLKNELSQRSPARLSDASHIVQGRQTHSVIKNDANETQTPLRFFHETFIGPK